MKTYKIRISERKDGLFEAELLQCKSFLFFKWLKSIDYVAHDMPYVYSTTIIWNGGFNVIETIDLT